MGLFGFIKDAGKKVFGRDEDEATPKGPAPVGTRDLPSANERKADALSHAVHRMGLGVTALKVEFNAGTATVFGNAPDQETREKVVLTIGNTFGVAQVDDRMVVTNPKPQARLHTVEAGDTLSAIAAKYLGKASRYPEIFEANKPMLEDPDKIYPGQVLRIPAS